VFRVAQEQKNQVLLALSEEGREERSKLRGHNGENFSNAYAREKRFERVAFLAPERSFSENHAHSTCAICVEDFKILDLVRETQCGHSFHSECLMMWAKQKLWANTRFIGVPQCPCCNSVLTEVKVNLIDAKVPDVEHKVAEALDSSRQNVVVVRESAPQLNVQLFVIHPQPSLIAN
jgi:hypothetical protein